MDCPRCHMLYLSRLCSNPKFKVQFGQLCRWAEKAFTLWRFCFSSPFLHGRSGSLCLHCSSNIIQTCGTLKFPLSWSFADVCGCFPPCLFCSKYKVNFLIFSIQNVTVLSQILHKTFFFCCCCLSLLLFPLNPHHHCNMSKGRKQYKTYAVPPCNGRSQKCSIYNNT